MAKLIYKVFDSFVLRSPLYPLSVKNNMNNYINKDAFREALFLASPTFAQQTEKKQDSDKNTKLSQSLYKYFSRSFSRSTPFGLFAGCSVGDIGNYSKIELKPLTEYTRYTRLDMNYLCAIIQFISQQQSIRNQLKYYPNDSIYEAGGRYRYVEYYYKKTHRIHNLNSVEKSEYIQCILDKSRSGALVETLAKSIIEEDISFEEAEEFVQEMISSQLLISELDAQTTGDIDPLNRLISQLEKLNNTPILPQLKSIWSLLREMDSLPLGHSSELYDKIIEEIKSIGVDYELKYLFQTDLFKPTHKAYLCEEFVNEINELFIFLMSIPSQERENDLTRFMNAFSERYEGQEIPLAFALDTELGIGYPIERQNKGDMNPIIADIFVPNKRGGSQSINFNKTDEILLEKYIEVLRSGANEIILSDKDFPSSDLKEYELPTTFAMMCTLVREKLSDSIQCIVKSIGNTSAANLLGRFCHIDSKIENLVMDISVKEQQLEGDVILAEIAHLPESRTGNIALRPVLRDYEIHYLAYPGANIEKQIAITDILISVKNGNLVLRSKSLNKTIIPRLTNAHNYKFNSMPVYHFLCDMQAQNKRTNFRISWQGIFEKFDYLPRIRYKNFILSLQSWKIKRSELNEIENLDDGVLVEKITEIRNKHKLPIEVTISEGDNSFSRR